MNGLVNASIKKPMMYRITLAQLVVLIPLIFGLCFIYPKEGEAAIAGVLIESTGRAYFGFYAFRYVGAQRISLVLQSFKKGELGKFAITVIMFGALFALMPNVELAAVFLGYLASWVLGTMLSIRVLK